MEKSKLPDPQAVEKQALLDYNRIQSEIEACHNRHCLEASLAAMENDNQLMTRDEAFIRLMLELSKTG